MSWGVGQKCTLDPALLGLWHRLVATALIRPLAWQLSYATVMALSKRQKKIRPLKITLYILVQSLEQ